MKPGVFYFSFYNELTGEEVGKGFVFTWPEDQQKFFGEITDRVVALEDEYGVHDWGTSPNEKVEAFGYASYEVDPSKYDELMTKWRNVFVGLLGEETVGPVKDFDVVMDDDDYAIYKKLGGVE